MKYTKPLLLAAAAVPALWAFARPADKVTFHPEEGLSLTKTFTELTELTMESMSVSMNGEELDPSMLGDPEMNISNTTTRVVTDVYLGMGEGRPTKLKRTYDTLGSESNSTMEMAMMGSQDMDMSGSSELEGLTVVFTWDDDAGDYVVAFEDEAEGDSELLEGLKEDMDLRGLLPSGEVSAEDTWEIPPRAMLPLLAPGGNLKIKPEDLEEMGMGMGPNPSGDLSTMLGDLEGTASGEYAGTREVDGVTVGVIKFTFDVSSAKDMTDEINEMMSEVDMPEMEVDVEIDSMDVEFEFQGEGVLYWVLSAGHLHSFEISGDMSMTMDMAMSMEVPQMGQMEQEMSMEFSGTTTLSGKLGAE